MANKTLAELEKELKNLERDIARRFLDRTNLADMMTPKDKAKHDKLFAEWYKAAKGEGKI